MSWRDVTIVDACLRRDGNGGNPTAVTDDDPTATDADRYTVAVGAGTSHAAFLGPARTPDGGWPVRFFTATAELFGCGHGTVAAQAVRLTHTGRDELHDRQHTGGRTFDTVAIRRPTGIEVWFDQGLVALRTPTPQERAAVLDALGLAADDPHPSHPPRIAAPGAPRMLVPVQDRPSLFRVRPHSDRLTAACRRYGLLGCFVYVAPVGDLPGAARMFAPAIGVAEDIANANSTGCLAAHLLDTTGAPTITIEVEQGDTLGRPASVFASATHTPTGITTRVGGLAVLRDTLTVTPTSRTANQRRAYTRRQP